MKTKTIKTIGFIGGGRITRIFLHALKEELPAFEKVVVSDPGPEKLQKVKAEFPHVQTVSDNRVAGGCDVIFLAVHPQNMQKVLEDIRPAATEQCIIVSLAPSFPIAKIREFIGNKCCVVRVIPNAPSVIRKGYNLIALSGCEKDNEKHRSFIRLMKHFGHLAETSEDKLEAYALITGMGPTYFWFQFHELLNLAVEMGLTEEEARKAIAAMVKGSVEILLESDLSYEEVMDLIPFHPLVHHSEKIKSFYREVIGKLYQKMKEKEK